MTIIDTLKSCELFEGLEVYQLEKIANICRGRSFKEGMVVFKEGDEARELYVLTEGKVALEMNVQPVPNRAAIPTAVEVVSKGESFGLSAAIKSQTYTLSARCMTNCAVLAIKADILEKVMSDEPSLGYELMKRLARLIRRRLAHTRLRLVSGLGLVMLGKELWESK